MSFITSILKTLISLILAMFTTFAPSEIQPEAKPNEPINADECLLSFTAMADLHMKPEEHNEFVYNSTLLKLVLSDCADAEVKPDALIVAGDVTNYGTEAEWDQVKAHFAQYDVAQQVLFAVGNHDTWTRDESNKTYGEIFTEYSTEISGMDISNIYYSTDINGYPFIFLASETDSTSAYFSDTQLRWLEAEMEKAAATGKPIFVISHWPLNKTHGLPLTWGEEDYDDFTGGIGEQSAAVKDILGRYENVFFITGHIHNGLSNAETAKISGYQSVEQLDNITLVNLPSINAGFTNGYMLPGTGYNVEVYPTEVVFRARNYSAGTWLPDYDYTIALK